MCVENILHVNNILPKKLEPYLAFLWEKLHVHYVNKKSRAVSTFMLMIFNVMEPKLGLDPFVLLFVYSTVPNISPYTIIKFLEGPKYGDGTEYIFWTPKYTFRPK